MIMRIGYLFILIIIASANLPAQEKLKFHSQNYVGLLSGSYGNSLQLQTINGLQWKTLFAGLGTGLDYYYFRSVPLFLSVNKFICPCQRSFFFNVDGGVNWVWETASMKNNFWTTSDYSPSLYWGAGFGYKIGLKNNRDAFMMGLGYSSKHVKENIRSAFPCQVPPCPDAERYDYRLNRLSLKVGWQF
ncbi:MAG: hypothetical protein J7497_13850 [Chitinophagaceae bacterium]|nr:hypothetical protein [Chitinophagaceae bacterium]